MPPQPPPRTRSTRAHAAGTQAAPARSTAPATLRGNTRALDRGPAGRGGSSSLRRHPRTRGLGSSARAERAELDFEGLVPQLLPAPLPPPPPRLTSIIPFVVVARGASNDPLKLQPAPSPLSPSEATLRVLCAAKDNLWIEVCVHEQASFSLDSNGLLVEIGKTSSSAQSFAVSHRHILSIAFPNPAEGTPTIQTDSMGPTLPTLTVEVLLPGPWMLRLSASVDKGDDSEVEHLRERNVSVVSRYAAQWGQPPESETMPSDTAWADDGLSTILERAARLVGAPHPDIEKRVAALVQSVRVRVGRQRCVDGGQGGSGGYRRGFHKGNSEQVAEEAETGECSLNREAVMTVEGLRSHILRAKSEFLLRTVFQFSQ